MEKARTEPGQPLWPALFSGSRPAHWVKNLLVFVPVLAGHRLTDVHTLLRACAACGLLCLASSSAYLFNDILDAEADRRHPVKRLRPFARGTVSIRTGVLAGIVLATLAVSLGWLLGPLVSLLLGLYLTGALLYSKWLKQLLVVDMLLLASFYILRVFVGGVATDIRISFWTLLFCLFIFIGLATVKRYAEIHNRSVNAVDSPNRRDYTPNDAAPLLAIGTSSFMGAIIALGLYLGSPDVRILYRTPNLLWLICPILLGWTSRLWILGHRGELHDEDPVAFALKDRWTHVAALLAAAVFALSF